MFILIISIVLVSVLLFAFIANIAFEAEQTSIQKAFEAFEETDYL